TLLKCITGILEPSRGKINVHGRISPLLELGAGFHAELSGRENIYINAAILGLSRKQINERIDKIIDFSELGDFIDTQVKFYSSGMYIRLGFAVAVFSDPDILLVDEVLAVGDESFRKKSFDKIREFQSLDKTIILVTHDMHSASQFCDRLMLLKKGKLVGEGKPHEVVRDYVDSTVEAEKSYTRGTKDIVIESVELLDNNKKKCKKFSPGDYATIQAIFKSKKAVNSPIFGFEIHDHQGNHCFGTNTKLKKIDTGIINGYGTVEFSLENLPMLDGNFYITLAATSSDGKNEYHWLENCIRFKLINPSDDVGSFYIPVKCSLKHSQKTARKETIKVNKAVRP
ncbi:hypothetical protein LCGC14_2351920, partial [marine sediment metagenome]